MSIVRDDCDERQIRGDHLVEELRNAQLRRVADAITVKGDHHTVEPQADGASGGVAVDRSTTASTTHSNG